MRWGAIQSPLPQLAWRGRLSEARGRLTESLWPVTQAATAAGLAWLVAHNLLGHAQPFFAPIAAAIALSTSAVRRGRRILQMIAGVMIGIVVSEAAAAVMGTSWISIAITVLVTMAAASAVAIGFFGEGMMFVNQSASAAVLVIALHHHGTGSERAIDALIGGGVAAVIGVGLFPAHPLRMLRAAEREVLRSLAGALAEIGELLEGAGRVSSGWTRAAAQDIHSQLAALTAARQTARANVRIAPRRFALRAEVGREDTRIAILDLLANAALSLLRVASDALDQGEAVEPAIAACIRDLAAAIGELAAAAQPWPEELRDSIAQRMVTLGERAGSASAARGPVLASAVRSAARDVRALVP
ncbi:MAG TPA: FUSC family protein [Solirubrobacteraceae bacterium]|nr:FUSC family protein [Solirubrobacteraceae bacterium]